MMVLFPRFLFGQVILLLVSSVPFLHVAQAVQCFAADGQYFRAAVYSYLGNTWGGGGAYGPIEQWCTKYITDMNSLFLNAQTFNADISGWDTSSVEDMSSMFSVALAFNQNLSNWDTSKVKNMNSMFYAAMAFNGDIGGWDTSSVEDMTLMFSFANSFNRDISQWDISSVQQMKSMFQTAYIFNQNLCPWKYDVPFGAASLNIFKNSGCQYKDDPVSGSSAFCGASAIECMNYQTPQPTHQPTAAPSSKPTSPPSPNPTHQPTPVPSSKPTSPPSPNPTHQPTHQPTAAPSSKPTSPPSPNPTHQPTHQPTPAPSSKPTSPPSPNPTHQPTHQPTPAPSSKPTSPPSPNPTHQPTTAPSSTPTSPPTPSQDPDSAPGPTPLFEDPPSPPTPSQDPDSAPGLFEDSPTPGPTLVVKSWALDMLSFSSNFDLDSTSEITLNYEIGAERDFNIGLFSKGCIEEVTDNVVTHKNSTFSAEDASLENLQVLLDVKKNSIVGSNIWNDSKKMVELCVRVELLSGDNVIKRLERNFGVELLFGTNFQTIEDAKFGQIFVESNQTDAQVENYIEACTCDNKESFTCNQNVLGPNDFLNICINSAEEEMEIHYLESLKLVQGDLTLNIVQEQDLVDGTISSKSKVQLMNGVHVASVIPASFFSYEGDTTGEVSGVVYLKLKDSRRRLAVEIFGHDSTTVAARALQTGSTGDQEAAFAIQVKLEKNEFLALQALANGAVYDVMSGFIIFASAFGFAVAYMMMW